MQERTIHTINICVEEDESIERVLETVTPKQSSIRKFSLMSDDFVRLDFDLMESKRFPIGCYINDPIFGKFYITKEQMPSYNEATASYAYSIQFDAEYMRWRNKQFMMTTDASSTPLRKEVVWTLTSDLQTQLEMVVSNLEIIGFTKDGKKYTYHISEDLKTQKKVFCMSYNGTSIIEALNKLAETWETEWYVTDNVINFGKCDRKNRSIEFSLEDNVQSMSIQNDAQESFANKIYVYGSEKNLPLTYRKVMRRSITKEEKKDIMLYTLGTDKITKEMSMYSSESIGTKPYTSQYASNLYISDYTIYHKGGMLYVNWGNILFSSCEFGIGTDTYKASVKYRIGICIKKNGVWKFEKSFTCTDNSVTEYDVSRDISQSLGNNVFDDFVIERNEGYIDYDNKKIRLCVEAVWEATPIMDVNKNASVPLIAIKSKPTLLKNANVKYGDGLIPITSNGVKGYIMPNPLNVPFKDRVSNIDYYKVAYLDENKNIQKVHTANFNQGSTFVVDDTKGTYPTAYYVNEYDDPTSLLNIGANRLRLPNKDYIGEDSIDAIEKSVLFEDVYPDGKLVITSVSEEVKTDYTTYENEETKTAWKGIEYTIKAKFANNTTFEFSDDYRLDDTKLEARFITMSDLGDEYHENEYCKLAGMTFEVAFNKVDNSFTLIANNDFGTQLPNNILKPSVGDPFVLIGWNTDKVKDMGLISTAEETLLRKAQEYYDALKDGQFTFNCTMYSDYMFKLEEHMPLTDKNGVELKDKNNNTLFVKMNYYNYDMSNEGTRVTILHDSLTNGKKESRVIGYEYKWDKPYDTPTFTIGETKAYSRLAKIEKEISKLS